MLTKEEIINVEIAVGSKSQSVAFTPVAGRVIGFVAFHNKEEKLFANLSVKADDGSYISKPQHIENYRSRNTCYFDGCKPVDFQTQGKTYYVEVSCDEAVTTEPMKVQLILIYEDTRFNDCQK